jgi:hypothetical protein
MSSNNVRKCSNGHVMDPSWDSCPYCKARESSNQISGMVESERKPTIVLGQPESKNDPPKRTMVDGMPQPTPGGGRETIILNSEDVTGAPKEYQPTDTRNIVGVLVSYSWVRGGQLFPVREGKNYIGSGHDSTVSSIQDCDIQIPHDEKMSRVHSLLLCRSGKNEIIDQQSTNGTFLNGELLMSNQSVGLESQAEIKTGSTSWIFIKIEPQPGP